MTVPARAPGDDRDPVLARLTLTGESRPLDSAAPPPIDLEAEAWIDSMVQRAHIPLRERDEIRDELRDHLRERRRDLMLTGLTEELAARRALAEFGGDRGARSMAARFTGVSRRPLRRLAMNAAIFGLAGGAMLMSVVAVSRPGDAGEPPRRATEYVAPQPATADAAGTAAQAPAATFNAKFEQTPLRDVLQFAAAQSGLTPVIHWRTLDSSNIQPETPVTLQHPRLTTEALFKYLNEGAAEGASTQIGWRIDDGVLEVAAQSWFDKRDTTLVAYDLSSILPPDGWTAAAAPGASPAGGVPVLSDIPIVGTLFVPGQGGQPTPTPAGTRADEILLLIQDTIEPTIWAKNGGDLASTQIVGRTMFVKAPRRIQPQVEWIIQQLERGSSSGGAAPAPQPGRTVPDARRPAPEPDQQLALIYVSGLVSHPGVYAMPTQGSLTLRRVLDSAGGLAADAKRVTIERGTGEDAKVIHEFTVDELRTAASPDPEVAPSDRVCVR